MFLKKSISNKINDKKVTKIQIYFNNIMERKRLQTKLSGRFIWWQPINFEIIACSYLFILLLSSCIFWTKNKQKQRITWKQMHWFLAKQSSTNLKKNLINIHMHKLSFCYFYHDEIYLLHENFYEFSLEILYKT